MRRLAGVFMASAALLGIGGGASQAATVPWGTPSKAVVVERNQNGRVTSYKLADAGPMTGLYGEAPVGDGEVYSITWTEVGPDRVDGTGKYFWGRMGSYRSGPVTILLTGSGYRYTRISITATQSWYGYTTGKYPPYGRGEHHTTAHIHVAVNDLTTNMIRF